jgi:signal transduction histidine kinase
MSDDDVRRPEMDTPQPFQQVIASLESFNGMVSHDLLGPLADITHLAELALRALADGRLERVADSLTLIRGQGRMSSQLLASLLLLARAKAGPCRKPIELSRVVAGALEQVRLERPDAARVQWVIHDLPLMNADPTLVQQVFVNLIGNAVKSTASVPSPRIEIGTEPAGGATAIFVRDDGIGFNGRSARLFEPLAHTASPEGAGIGLSIVRRIVEIHGGRLWCKSRPGEGATLYFTLAEASP